MAIVSVGRRIGRGYVGALTGLVLALVVDSALGDASFTALPVICIALGIAVSQLIPLRPKPPRVRTATPSTGPPPAPRPRPPAPSNADARLWISPPRTRSPAPGWRPDGAA